MIDMRKAKGLTRQRMAVLSECSEDLIYQVEKGTPTHPDIASNIARAYGMNIEQYNQIVPEKHRANAIPKYKPPRRDMRGMWWHNEQRQL